MDSGQRGKQYVRSSIRTSAFSFPRDAGNLTGRTFAEIGEKPKYNFHMTVGLSFPARVTTRKQLRPAYVRYDPVRQRIQPRRNLKDARPLPSRPRLNPKHPRRRVFNNPLYRRRLVTGRLFFLPDAVLYVLQ